ncbi:MAG: hypothetical protein IAI48_00525 [Candidatus Eremiobacteraeota bacterium]|nr:hypothetical protein [Candidatus Eremiobacteraeota bacterium]
MANDKNPLPALTSDERATLKASIASEGIVYPIVTSAGPFAPGTIVDGFNRREIWLELGKKDADLPRITRRFANEAELRIAQIDLNVKRRQLTVPQRVMLAMAREPWERKLAQQRLSTKGKGASGAAVEKLRQGEPARAAALAAEAVGLKRDTYEHGKLVLEKGPADVREQFLAGTITVNNAYSQTRRALGVGPSATMEKHVGSRIGRVPSGSYGAILVLAPWRAGTKAFEAGRVLPAELSALSVRSAAAKDAVVALVAPARWMREAIDVVAAWGANVVTIVARVRPSATAATPIAERADFVIVATFGRPVLPSLSRDNVVETDAQLYSLLDALVPDREGIVLFGDTSRPGWSSWDPPIK